ncbi:hypothetical protein J7J39_00940 [bacterium]|nr:hypothetical protein [bacterium]
MLKDIRKQIKELAEKNLQRVGEWEIAQVPEPVFNLQSKNGVKAVLNLVVHRESYFIFNTYVCFPEEINSAAKTLLEAIEEYKIIPEILLVREKRIIKELEPIAQDLNFAIAYPVRLKAVPIVLREMRKTLRQF